MKHTQVHWDGMLKNNISIEERKPKHIERILIKSCKMPTNI